MQECNQLFYIAVVFMVTSYFQSKVTHISNYEVKVKQKLNYGALLLNQLKFTSSIMALERLLT